MKPIPTLKTKWLACGFAAILLGSTALAGAAGNEPIIHTTGKVSYVSGGVGNESIDRLSALSSEFNVKLVFAMTSGEYISGVKVVVTDARGLSVVDAVSDGPWLLARLPAGDYRIVASQDGKAKKQQIAVGTAKLMTVDFRWAAN
jgi:hypothetical protein